MAVSAEILELMQKLKNMTIENGCTPAEAQNAAFRLSQMLIRHQLTITDVNAQKIEEGVEKIVLERPDGKKWGYGVIEFASEIAYAFDCQLLYTPHHMFFVGIESDVRVATFFFDQTHTRVMDAGRTLGRADDITGSKLVHYVQNFVAGAGVAIHRRLKDKGTVGTGLVYTAEKAGQVAAQCTALVPIKQQKVKEYMAQTFPSTRTHAARPKRDGAKDGWEYGNNMELQRGLEAAKSAPVAALGGGA